jgi:hypothetical protein
VLWGGYLAVAMNHGIAAGTSTASDPITAATSQLLGYGVLGIAVIVLAWVVYQGSFVTEKAAAERVTAARADLLAENERLRTEKQKAEDQRDAALKVAQEQLVPLLTSFVATSQSLIPLLQELVRNRER